MRDKTGAAFHALQSHPKGKVESQSQIFFSQYKENGSNW
jgi:hypothetical protein